MMRKIVSVITGYAIFVATSLLLFKISKQDPHASPSTFFLILTIVYGVLFSFVAGLVTQLIARTTSLQVNFILAFVIAGFAIFSYVKSEGNHWTQLLAIFIFAPASILGGLFHNKQHHK